MIGFFIFSNSGSFFVKLVYFKDSFFNFLNSKSVKYIA